MPRRRYGYRWCSSSFVRASALARTPDPPGLPETVAHELVRESGLHEHFPLCLEAKASVERFGLDLGVQHDLVHAFHLRTSEKSMHQGGADLLLAPRRDNGKTTDVAIGEESSGADRKVLDPRDDMVGVRVPRIELQLWRYVLLNHEDGVAYPHRIVREGGPIAAEELELRTKHERKACL